MRFSLPDFCIEFHLWNIYIIYLCGFVFEVSCGLYCIWRLSSTTSSVVAWRCGKDVCRYLLHNHTYGDEKSNYIYLGRQRFCFDLLKDEITVNAHQVDVWVASIFSIWDLVRQVSFAKSGHSRFGISEAQIWSELGNFNGPKMSVRSMVVYTWCWSPFSSFGVCKNFVPQVIHELRPSWHASGALNYTPETLAQEFVLKSSQMAIYLNID